MWKFLRVICIIIICFCFFFWWIATFIVFDNTEICVNSSKHGISKVEEMRLRVRGIEPDEKQQQITTEITSKTFSYLIIVITCVGTIIFMLYFLRLLNNNGGIKK